MLIRLWCTIVLLAFFANAANILYLSNMPSPSHHIWNSAIFNELARRGHNLTVLSPDIDKSPVPGVHTILIENQYNGENKEFIKEVLKAEQGNDAYSEVLGFFDICTRFCELQMLTNGFKTLANYPDNFKFDLIIYDYTLGSCFLPFVHKFQNPPLIAVSAYSNPTYTTSSFGGHNYYGYIPHTSIVSDKTMSFVDRLNNFAIHIVEYISRQFSLIPALDKIARKHFGPNLPSLGDIERQASLVFVSTTPAMDFLAPLPENVIPVAGVQIKEPKPIPKDLKEFIDSAKKGAVIFSLGTNFRSEFLPLAKQKIFLEVFRELPDYHFFWKFESNISESELPKNLQIRPWLPISNMLADPNIKAIYFHGGLLTTQEALWRGVPMIIMPFGFDQNQNLFKTKKLGVSEGIDYFKLNKETTKNAFLKVLQNPLYAVNARKASARFRDQKEKPLDRAVWWAEWLIRNPDANHMKSPVLRLGFIAANAYDIIVFIILATAATIFVVTKLICMCTQGKNVCDVTKLKRQ